MTIGVLSDTHGSLHPLVLPHFRHAGVEFILHAGDVGSEDVLHELSELARVEAVRGNVDTALPLSALPLEIDLTLGGVRIFMTHIGFPPQVWASRLALPAPDVVICGHSHIPLVQRVGKTIFLNPGAAGTRPRFGGELSAALLHIKNGHPHVEMISLQEGRQG